jgi:hypothetical protein
MAPRLEQCIVDAAAELGITKQDAEEIADRLKQHRAERALQNRLANIDDDIRKFAADRANEMRVAAAQKRKHAALKIIAARKLGAYVDGLTAQGMSERDAIVARMVGSVRGMFGARASAAAARIGMESEWLDGLVREIKRDKPHLIKLITRGDAVLMRDVTHEMWEIRPNGKPGKTGNKDAQFLGGVLSKYLEMARLRENDAGAFIGKLPGYIPTHHDAVLVAKAGFKSWKEKVSSLIDRQRTFRGASDAEIERTWNEIYQNIVTGKDASVTGKEQTGRVGPSNLADQLNQHRVLHFKDADAWNVYNAEYGQGNAVTATVSQLHKGARVVSLMEAFGPNPQNTLNSFLAERQRVIREDPNLDAVAKRDMIDALKADLDNPHASRIGMAFAEIMGDTMAPANITIAKRAQTIRAIQSMAKLGGATLSAVSDLATFATQMKYQGKGLFQVWGDTLKATIKGRSVAEQSEIGSMISTGFSTVLGEMQARYTADDMIPGGTASALTTFFKLTGLTGWTDRLLSAFTAMSSQHMAFRAKSGWSDLDPQYQHFLGIHGIGAEKWEAARKLVMTDAAGDSFVIPDGARTLSDADIDAMIAGELADVGKRLEGDGLARRTGQLRAQARRDLETSLRALFADEARFGVLHGDDRTRMVTTAGTKPGTAVGEAIRFLAQFKSFGIAYSTKVLGRAFVGGRKVREGIRLPTGVGLSGIKMSEGRFFQRTDFGSVAHIVAASLVMGYLASAAKDLAKGRTPKDPTHPATLMASLVQGGGLGIYSDFLFGRYSRMGNTPLETLAGPTIGTGSDIVSLLQGLREGEAKAGDVFHLALSNTPYVNLWYTRAALDYLIIKQIEEMLSPGTGRRRERRLNEQFGNQSVFE